MTELLGKWKIIDMEQWGQDYIDLVEPGYIRFDGDDFGEFVFGTVRGYLDCRTQMDSEPLKIEFSWVGDSENDPVSGRGWAVIDGEGQISGMLFIHCGDESWFKATKMPA